MARLLADRVWWRDLGWCFPRTLLAMTTTPMIPPCPIHWDGDFVVLSKQEVICPKCGTRYRVERREGNSTYHAVNEKAKKEAI